MAHAEGKNRVITIVTVHGTGDTADSAEGAKWFQRGSAFAKRLQDDLSARGIESEIIPHLWSGANSSTARERAAQALARTIKGLSNAHQRVHVVGHSHGGNVAIDAACMLGWTARSRLTRLASISTVGTPFLQAQITSTERVGAWVFLALIALSVIFFPVLFAYIASEGLAALAGWWRALIAFAVAVLTLPLALAGVARVSRISRRARGDTDVFSLWHPADEAISFLQQLDQSQIEPFPRWSLFRASRAGGITWGVRSALATAPVIALTFFAWPLIVSLAAWLDPCGCLAETLPRNLSDTVESYPLFFALAMAVLLAAVVFLGVYALYRLLAGLAADMWLRKSLNRMVGGALKGLAFGRDGENRIGAVATRTHYFATKEQVLDGDAAKRMSEAAEQATRRLFDKYRASVFRIGADPTETLRDISQDAMTWDSLVHTTYFDQPETSAAIADHIASTVASAS